MAAIAASATAPGAKHRAANAARLIPRLLVKEPAEGFELARDRLQPPVQAGEVVDDERAGQQKKSPNLHALNIRPHALRDA